MAPRKSEISPVSKGFISICKYTLQSKNSHHILAFSRNSLSPRPRQITMEMAKVYPFISNVRELGEEKLHNRLISDFVCHTEMQAEKKKKIKRTEPELFSTLLCTQLIHLGVTITTTTNGFYIKEKSVYSCKILYILPSFLSCLIHSKMYVQNIIVEQ
jgi:hypothetical protein